MRFAWLGPPELPPGSLTLCLRRVSMLLVPACDLCLNVEKIQPKNESAAGTDKLPDKLI